MKQEQFEQIEGILHSFADSFQTYGGFCIQFNDGNMSDFCLAADKIATSIEAVADSIDRLAAAVESLSDEQ